MKTENRKPLRKQMYIITVSCWKCKGDFNIALIHGNAAINNGQVYGPESFSPEEIKITESNGVIIKMHHSATRNDDYNANTCPHCGTFTGHHYHFEYFTGAEYGDYQFRKIDID